MSQKNKGRYRPPVHLFSCNMYIKLLTISVFASGGRWEDADTDARSAEEREDRSGGGNRGTGSEGENDPLWPDRNSPVPFPAGSLTSHCVHIDVCGHVCVSWRSFLSGECGGGSFSPLAVI